MRGINVKICRSPLKKYRSYPYFQNYLVFLQNPIYYLITTHKEMKRFPTSQKIFGFDSLGEKASDSLKMDILHKRDECVSETLNPYREIFNSKIFRFEEGKMELLSGPTGFMFGENDSIAPVTGFTLCNSFMKLKGSKYEHLLSHDHIIKPSFDDESDCQEPIGLELDYAEKHSDSSWDYYSDIDEESYQRVVCCYREAAEDNNLNALWCLGCALNLRHGHFKEDYDVLGLTYYYLSLAIQKGHLACIPSLCDRLMNDGMHKEAFMFTYIGAQQKEIYCMWNFAMYYLCGLIVPKSEKRAVELLESILCVINQKDGESAEFYNSHYDGINKEDISELKEYTEHNLKIIRSHNDSWRKYFDVEVCRKYRKVLDVIMDKYLLDPSITPEKYAEIVNEHFNKELNLNQNI